MSTLSEVAVVALHALNHVVDLTEADPEWWGYAVLVLLTASTAVFAWLARAASVTSAP